MKNWLLASALCIAMQVQGTELNESHTLYRNVSLIDTATGEVTTNAFLWVAGDRLAYVGGDASSIPADIEIIDLNGMYVTPGFIDTHAHMSLGEVTFSFEDGNVLLQAGNRSEIAAWNGQQLLAHGVTSIRNPGGDTRANLAYKQAQLAGDIVGPRAFVAGAILSTDEFAGLTVQVNDEVAITQAIAYQASQGVDFIKLYTGLNAEQIEIAVGAASEWELPVIAHLESVSWQTGSELGIDHLVHAMPVSPDLLAEDDRADYLAQLRPGNFNWFEWFHHASLESNEVQRLIETLVTNGTSVDPTLIVFYNAFFGNTDAVTGHRELDRVHADLLSNWRDFFHFNLGWQDDDYAMAQAAWPKVLAFVQQLHEQGVLLTVGTDLGNPWVIPGVSYVQEMKLLVEAGIAPADVLKMATLNGAVATGFEHELGRLAPGFMADFVVFANNPAEDIDHIDTMQFVVQGGQRVFTR